MLWCLISVSVVSVGRSGVAVSGGVVHGSVMHDRVDSMMDRGGVVNHRGVVDGMVRSGVVNSVSCSTEVGESSEGHVRAGSHEGDESNQGKGL